MEAHESTPLPHPREEFGTLLSSLGQNPTEQELQEWIGGDGEHDASRIDFHTFLSLMSRKLKETDPGQHCRGTYLLRDNEFLAAIRLFLQLVCGGGGCLSQSGVVWPGSEQEGTEETTSRVVASNLTTDER